MDSPVRKGCALLDQHYPGWHKTIDLTKLDIHSCYDCILGQMFGSYGAGLDKLGLTVGGECGFSDYVRGNLTQEWAGEIKARLAVDRGCEFLDEAYPEWHKKINLGMLNVGDGFGNCVLSQVNDSFYHQATLELDLNYEHTEALGFVTMTFSMWPRLQDAWVAEIRRRQNAHSECVRN